MNLPDNYIEKVYAGVLGKIIGVYLGRPFEGWGYRKILSELGPIHYYVHERRNVPLVVTDDDISGTFTFIRAMEDYAEAGADISAEQIGQTWLNYIIEQRTILWWGGVGMSTEHTAFKNLQAGITAPRSGSIGQNGRVVAEQIGSQIFIDGWGMISPGDPEQAASLARRAASVSHDGEAIYGAQVVAAMVAMAFVESDLHKLLDVAVKFIPRDSVIFRMISDLRAFREKHDDWNHAMTDVMEKHYGYDKFGGNCHMIPNHGLIILGLLYGEDDFQKSLMIANTCGWDTDCNSGNVGAILGVKNGLAGIDAGPDWRGPVADRLYLPTADGGSCVTDAPTQAYKLVNIARGLRKESPIAPKNGARFHFSLPGSVQGFVADTAPEARGATFVEHAGQKLAIRYHHLATGRPARAGRATFTTPEMAKLPHYSILAAPMLSPGQTVSAFVQSDASNPSPVNVRLFIRYFGDNDTAQIAHGPDLRLSAGVSENLTWKIPDLEGHPIYEVGIEINGERGTCGVIQLDSMHWTGTPDVTLGAIGPHDAAGTQGEMWRKQWAEGVDQFHRWGRTDESTQAYCLIQNQGRGLAITGTRDWSDYTVSASLTPHAVQGFGLAARVQGMRRYYALILATHQNKRVARLIKALDGDHVLAETPFDWKLDSEASYALSVTVQGARVTAGIDGKNLFDVTDSQQVLSGGGIALVAEVGRLLSGPVRVTPV